MMRPFAKNKGEAALATQVDELKAQIAELQAKLSVLDGRSSLNAERNVRTHSSLQNLAEDFELVAPQLRLLVSEQAHPQEPESESA